MRAVGVGVPLAQRLVEAREPHAVAAVDAVGPLEFAEHLFVNTDLTVHLQRPPAGSWVLLDSRTVADPIGAGLAWSSLYDEQVRVPLILVAPQLPAARIAAPVESIDIAPTLLGLLGVNVPASMRGQDLRALALGRDPDRGPVFSAVIHKKMVVRWPWKLIADLRFGLFELYDLDDGVNAPKRSYASLAEELGVTVTDVTNYLSSARREFRRTVLEKLRDITASEEEYKAEARAILGVGD